MKLLICVVGLIVALGTEAREARVLTWNTYMIPQPFKHSRQAERQGVIPRKLLYTDYDVIILQEAFMDSFKRRVRSALKETHPYVYWPKKVRGLFKILDSGLMVLSKTPLLEVDRTYYTACRSFDCFASKGAILLETELAGQEVQLVVTHMQSGQNPRAAAVRQKQLAQVQRLLERNRRPDVPQLFGGDLNINAYNTTEYEGALARLGMLAPQIAGKLWSTKATQTSCFGKPAKNELKRVDHIWLRDTAKTVKHARQQVVPIRGTINGMVCDLSDHLPVALDLQFAD